MLNCWYCVEYWGFGPYARRCFVWSTNCCTKNTIIIKVLLITFRNQVHKSKLYGARVSMQVVLVECVLKIYLPSVVITTRHNVYWRLWSVSLDIITLNSFCFDYFQFIATSYITKNLGVNIVWYWYISCARRLHITHTCSQRVSLAVSYLCSRCAVNRYGGATSKTGAILTEINAHFL